MKSTGKIMRHEGNSWDWSLICPDLGDTFSELNQSSELLMWQRKMLKIRGASQY